MQLLSNRLLTPMKIHPVGKEESALNDGSGVLLASLPHAALNFGADVRCAMMIAFFRAESTDSLFHTKPEHVR